MKCCNCEECFAARNISRLALAIEKIGMALTAPIYRAEAIEEAIKIARDVIAEPMPKPVTDASVKKGI